MQKPKVALIRDPAEWARDSGWISNRRAKTMAAKLEAIAEAIEDTLNDEGGTMWAKEIRKVAKTLARDAPALREP